MKIQKKNKCLFGHNKNQNNSLNQMQIWANRNQLKKMTLKSKFQNPQKQKNKCKKQNQQFTINFHKKALQNQYSSPMKLVNNKKTFEKLSIEKQKCKLLAKNNFFVTAIKTQSNLYHHKKSIETNFININKININNKKNKINNPTFQLNNCLSTKSERFNPAKSNNDLMKSFRSQNKKALSLFESQPSTIQHNQQKVKNFLCVSPKNIYNSQKYYYQLKQDKNKIFKKRSFMKNNQSLTIKKKLQQLSEWIQDKNNNDQDKQISNLTHQLKQIKTIRPRSCSLSNKYQQNPTKKRVNFTNVYNKQRTSELNKNNQEDDWLNSGWKVDNNEHFQHNEDMFQV